MPLLNIKRENNKIKKIGIFILFTLFLILVSSSLFSEKNINLSLEKILEIGKEDITLFNISSVYEDKEENFYVLDKTACKVYKFSPDGKLLLSFGSKGQGPGEFIRPHDLYVTDTGEIVVSEDMTYISFFEKNGIFIKRLALQKGLALAYLNDSLYYGWVWGENNREQILIDSQGLKLKSFFSVAKDASSISLPDESGRLVMFNYSREEYTPFLLFSRYKKHAAVGVGNNYEILILNKKGEAISRIKRDVKPQIISSKERKYLIKELEKVEIWPAWIIKKIEKTIPKVKSYFDKISISEKYVFVFRIKSDVRDRISPFPVDVFTLDGEFLGTSKIHKKPLLISDKYFYVAEVDEDDNLFLVKFRYHLRF